MERQDFINTINELRETIKTLQKTIEDLNANEERHKTTCMKCWISSRTSASISSPSTIATIGKFEKGTIMSDVQCSIGHGILWWGD